MQLSLCQNINPLASSGGEINAFSQKWGKICQMKSTFFSISKKEPVKIHPLMEKIQPLIMHHKIIKNQTTST